jgi:hypothetical protein
MGWGGEDEPAGADCLTAGGGQEDLRPAVAAAASAGC